jgi:hypothetical protein
METLLSKGCGKESVKSGKVLYSKSGHRMIGHQKSGGKLRFSITRSPDGQITRLITILYREAASQGV